MPNTECGHWGGVNPGEKLRPPPWTFNVYGSWIAVGDVQDGHGEPAQVVAMVTGNPHVDLAFMSLNLRPIFPVGVADLDGVVVKFRSWV